MTTLVGAGFAVAIEPDHTVGMPLLAAYGLWMTHFLAVSGLFLTTATFLRRTRMNDLQSVLVAAILLPLLFAPISLVLDMGFGKPDAEFAAGAPMLGIFWDEVLTVAPISLAVAVVLACILEMWRPQMTQIGAEQNPVTSQHGAATLPSLRSLIPSAPQHLGDNIIRLHAQDHYVEIVTTQGNALLSEQFGDCVDNLAPLDGFQCHRSHWINLAHIDGLSRSGSSYVCTLSNGDKVPVSRRRHHELTTKIEL